eukprot:7735535-Alexandrium_andersonii.AAC.1
MRAAPLRTSSPTRRPSWAGASPRGTSGCRTPSSTSTSGPAKSAGGKCWPTLRTGVRASRKGSSGRALSLIHI